MPKTKEDKPLKERKRKRSRYDELEDLNAQYAVKYDQLIKQRDLGRAENEKLRAEIEGLKAKLREKPKGKQIKKAAKKKDYDAAKEKKDRNRRRRKGSKASTERVSLESFFSGFDDTNNTDSTSTDPNDSNYSPPKVMKAKRRRKKSNAKDGNNVVPVPADYDMRVKFNFNFAPLTHTRCAEICNILNNTYPLTDPIIFKGFDQESVPKAFQGPVLSNHTPQDNGAEIEITGGGNCLYNALSFWLTGKDDQGMKFRNLITNFFNE